MPAYDVQVIGRSTTGLPRDNTVNVYHFTSGTNDGTGLAQACLDAYESVVGGGLVTAGIDKYTAKTYASGGAGSNPPLETKEGVVFQPGTPGPREVALCLSQKGSEIGSGLPAGYRAQSRGRTYIGPLKIVDINAERPSVALRQVLINLGQAIVGNLPPGYLWVAGSAKATIVEIYVDNEWDTQRRRGLRPTSRVSAQVINDG